MILFADQFSKCIFRYSKTFYRINQLHSELSQESVTVSTSSDKIVYHVVPQIEGSHGVAFCSEMKAIRRKISCIDLAILQKVVMRKLKESTSTEQSNCKTFLKGRKISASACRSLDNSVASIIALKTCN